MDNNSVNTFQLYGQWDFFVVYMKDIVVEITETFGGIVQTENMMTVDIKHLNNLIIKYHTNRYINWNLTIDALPLPLETSMIVLLLPNMKWKALVKNAGVNILALLRRFQNEIDWEEVQSCDLNIWTAEIVLEFKMHLLFKNRKSGESLFSKSGREYPNKSIGNDPLFKSISSSKIKWSSELIGQLLDYLDWEELSSNRHVLFSENLIREFETYWDWCNLSKNRSVYWSNDLLLTFSKFINLKTLSTNTNVDWGNSLERLKSYASESNDLDWKMLSMNRSFNAEMLESNTDLIVWSGTPNDNYGFEPFFDFKFNNWVQNRHIHEMNNDEYLLNWYADKYTRYFEYTKNVKINVRPSLSANTNFIWSNEIIAKHLKKLDFWIIALRGKLTSDIIIKHADFFDEVRLVYTSYRRHSDWGTFDVYHFCSGWENLALNSNFHPDEEFFAFAKLRNVRVGSTVDTFDSPDMKMEDFRDRKILAPLTSIITNNQAHKKFDYSNL